MPNTKTVSLICAEVTNNNNYNSVNNKVMMIIANVNGHFLSARFCYMYQHIYASCT